MRVVLVNVPTYGSHLRSIPLGLLYLASSCRQKGFEVDLLEGSYFRTREALDAHLLGMEFDVIGLSSMTHNYAEARRIAEVARRARPKARVVLGGVHASTVPAEVADECPECYVLSGEGEESLPALLAAFSGDSPLDSIPGLHFRQQGRLHSSAPRPIEDLDALPLPAYDMVDFAHYTVGVHGVFFKRKPLTTVITSRGCPFSCSFCAKTPLTGHTWRARSVAGVLDELELLTGKYGIREVHFEDDNIALDSDRLVAICEGIIQRGIDIAWKCPHGIYASHLDAETFRLMRRSGCYSLSFGVESGSDEILSKAGKASDTATIARSIESAHAADIECVGFFIFGLEGETPSTIRRTIDFAKSLPLDAAQFNLCVPFKGTPIRETYLRMGFVGEGALEHYDVDHAVVNLPGLSAADLKKWRLRAFLEFYLRPRVFFGNLRKVTSPDIFMALLARVRNIWQA